MPDPTTLIGSLILLAAGIALLITAARRRHPKPDQCASCNNPLTARTADELIAIMTALAAYGTPYCPPCADGILRLDAEIEETL